MSAHAWAKQCKPWQTWHTQAQFCTGSQGRSLSMRKSEIAPGVSFLDSSVHATVFGLQCMLGSAGREDCIRWPYLK